MADHQVEVDDELEILIEDDTPLQDKGKDLLPPDKENLGEPTEDELETYSKDVQARIKRLTFEKHDQRRKAEEVDRQLQEAARLNTAMRRQLAQYEAFSVGEGKKRVEIELADAKKAAAAAFDAGDGTALAEAQERVARLAPQHEQMSRYQPRQEQEFSPAPQAQPAPAQDRASEERLFGWMEKNKWFNSDEVMTKYAHGAHMQLVMADPASVGSDDYYQKLDREMRQAFPQKFEGNASRSSGGPPVVAVQRSAGGKTGSRKSVTLTESQVKLAARLGLSPKQYAEQLIKEGLN